MQTTSSWYWTQATVSISYNDNSGITSPATGFVLNIPIFKETHKYGLKNVTLICILFKPIDWL